MACSDCDLFIGKSYRLSPIGLGHQRYGDVSGMIGEVVARTTDRQIVLMEFPNGERLRVNLADLLVPTSADD